MNRKPDDSSRYGNCYWCIMCWLPLFSRQELGETYNVKPDDSFQNTSRFLTINASTHIKQCRYWFDQVYWDLIQAQRGAGSVIHIGHERQSQNVHVKLQQWYLHLQKHKMSNGYFSIVYLHLKLRLITFSSCFAYVAGSRNLRSFLWSTVSNISRLSSVKTKRQRWRFGIYLEPILKHECLRHCWCWVRMVQV